MANDFVKNTNLFGMEDEALDSTYATKVSVPQYLPKNECPNIDSLFNDSKYRELLNEINNSDVSEEQKQFLTLAATRHIQFRYDRVADYYAHQPKEMQELMEHSALVIIDLDDAIANGYVKLSQTIEKIRQASGKEKHYDNK